jgi:murein DD-endopeptidase MepM/ murein hydrolase activator NlpD
MENLGLIFDNLKDVLERQLLKIAEGRTAWMFGYRIHPVTGKPQLHNGVDLPNPTKYPIKAPLKSIVVKAWLDDKNGGGNYIVLSHPSSKFFIRTGYAHLDSFAVGIKAGMEIKAGDVIGFVGSTGASTGPHLHFTLRQNVNGVLQCVDSLPFLCAACGVVEMPIHLVG